MSFDFVLSFHQNWKYNSNFREVQNAISVSIPLVLERLHMQFFTGFTKCCIRLGNMVSLTPIVSETNWK